LQIPAIKGGKPVRKKFLIFGKPDIHKDEIKEVVATLKSGWIGTGPRTILFEKRFKKYIGCKYAVSVNSCTAGLFLSLKALGIGPGDEVITTPLTFAATANVIEHIGAKPVFVDVEKATGNIDAELIEEKVTDRTRAIIPVHLYGRPCEMSKIMHIAKDYGLKVIEDAAHAIEAKYKNKKIGTTGHTTCFSFYATKNLTTAEGGMITTASKKLAELLQIMRLHGISKDAWKRYSASGFKPYDVITPGYKFNMTDLQAALGLHQLKRIEKNLKRRKEICKMYNEAFERIDQLILMDYSEKGIKHARHLYTVLLDLKKLRINRNYFLEAMKREGIGCGIHFLSLHESKYYKKKYKYRKSDFKNAAFISDRTVSLPLAPNLSDKDISDVIKAVRKIINYFKK